MTIAAVGVVLIIIALILGAVQHYNLLGYSIYGTDETFKWLFYGLVGIIGLIGIILVVLAAMKKEGPTEAPKTPTQ